MWLDDQEKWLEENESLDTHAEWKTLLDSYSSLQVSVSSTLIPSLPPSLSLMSSFVKCFHYLLC